MKQRLLLLAMLALITSLLGGCAATLDKYVPDITADSLRYTRTGKFSSTTVQVEGLKSGEQSVAAAKVVVKHSNAWLPNLEIEAVNYSRAKTQKP